MLDWLLSLLGQAVLVYRTALTLNVGGESKALAQLGVKWLLFMGFIEFEWLLLEVAGWLPLGGLLLRGVKVLLVLPENSTTLYLIEKVQAYLENISHEEIESSMANAISQAAKKLSLWLLRLLEKVAPLVKSKDLQEVEEELQALKDKIVQKRREVTIRRSMRIKPSD